ncbi:hypothetical protein P152DRAFT_457804 [Eremomyces bilateralis CBS 781.70]|uniref:MARVEL domain-containing protein n=1 Tax=Eremomyces bilateralis CBS 781.70 TaxID=1392243 RepID=A0A6G1G5V2_9PEZI|nr:uncharacterized protein P152DRAFT_457804 [Eremomyces bilateralis CBS 781.70]KAF1813443.1 hypothetical protein P152DRAFT_457804 [Eremomyces bilateralis CBS 781.70]
MAFRTKTPPTHYPRFAFHFLRLAQLISSIIVGSIMCYFVYHLSRDRWGIPWTFILLLAVSFFTVLVLAGTMLLHCCFGLNPKLNLVLNSGLFVIWVVGFALLSWYSSQTLFHYCNKENWHEQAGVMVCRIYKALFTFALTGFTSTLAAMLLDIHVFRRSNRLGKYNPMQDLDRKPLQPGALHGETVFETSSSPRSSPSNSHNSAQHEGTKSTLRTPFSAKKAGAGENSLDLGVYQVPEEQFHYDTGYQGAGHGSNGRG